MAIAVVQTAGNHNSSTSSHAVTVSSTAQGSAIVVKQLVIAGGGAGSGITVTGVTDNKSNVYKQVPNAYIEDFNDGVLDAWYCPNAISGVTTITVAWSATVNSVVSVYELSGVSPTNPVDAVATLANETPANSPATGPALSTKTPGSIIISTCAVSTNAITGTGSGYTNAPVPANVGGSGAGYKITTAIVSGDTPTFTYTGTNDYIISSVAFKPPYGMMLSS